MILFFIGLLLGLLYCRRHARICVENYKYQLKLNEFEAAKDMEVHTPIYQQIATLDLRSDIRYFLVCRLKDVPMVDVSAIADYIMGLIIMRHPLWRKR